MTTTSNPGLAAARARLQQKLEEVFQFDCAELDFGVYRILNVKRAEFTRFLAGELDRVLDQNLGGSPERAARLQELAAIEKTAHDVGLPDATALPKWQKLHAELAAEAGPEELARDVFSHLAEFFSRYYDDGDFLARPRRGNAYAIPYDGSEVKLHWANADQYYIKTTEHFQVYDAEVSTGFTRIHLHFRIAAAENTERDNVKAAEKRYFMLREQAPVEVDGQHVTCWFDYRGADAKTNQAAQNALSQERIAAALPPELRQGLNKPKDTKDPKGRTLLGWHLLQYTEKNKRDFFIHKDLGGFLRQELDFYVKSEVLVLDDLDPADPGKAARVLQKVKTLRALAEPLIVWLAQIEDFQKKLWLKKKFVLAANWCVTLDRVIDKAPELLAEIAGNDLQRAAWVRLCAIDEIAAEKPKGQGGLFGTGGSAGRTGYSEPLTEAFLRENPGLMVDTQFFARPFVQRLQEKGVVSQVDGWALRGENAGVLRTMAETWRSEVQAIYIDPPYNAPASLVLYKNDFKHAAWLSMMNERLTAARQLQSDAGPLVVAIDENEQERLGMLLEQTHPDASRTCVTVVHNPRGIQGDNFAYSHEYAYFVLASGKKVVKPIQVPAAEWEWSSLRNWGGDSTRSFGWTLFYPIYVKDGAIVELGTAPPNEFHPSAGSINLQDGRIEVWPIDNSGVERKWRYARDSLAKRLDSARAVQKNGETQIEIAQIEERLKTCWTDTRFDAGRHGSTVLKNLGIPGFLFPKSVNTVEECLRALVATLPAAAVVDFFGGSGTTAHAVLNLNRQDGGNRRYTLVEMGDHYATVLVPRIQKVVYSPTWKDGKPTIRDQSLSHCLHYQRFESYDDTLDSLELRTAPAIAGVLDLDPAARRAYTLHYQLNLESKASLLNLDQFAKPWSYTMKVRQSGALVDQPVDLQATFRWLIGLTVKNWYFKDGLAFEEGETRTGEKVLVIWRDTELWPSERLCAEVERMQFSPKLPDLDLVYVNGDSHLPVVAGPDGQPKVRLIEHEFLTRMFAEEAA